MPIFVGAGTVVTSESIVDGEIINADIATDAAIALSKLANGAFVPLVDVTLGAPATQILSGTFAEYDILRFYLYIPSLASNANLYHQYNADTGANYRVTLQGDTGDASVSGSQTEAILDAGSNTNPKLLIGEIFNKKTNVKMTICTCGNNSSTWRTITNWQNTSDAITAIRFYASSNLGTGTRLVVFGMKLS